MYRSGMNSAEIGPKFSKLCGSKS